jgi:hypothetical protein
MENKNYGAYVRMTLSGKYGVVGGSFVLAGIEYYNITLNNFSTTIGTESEFEIIHYSGK